MSTHYAPRNEAGVLGVPVCRTMRHQPFRVNRTAVPAEVTCGRCLRSLRLRPWVEAMLQADEAPGPAGPGAEDTMRPGPRLRDPNGSDYRGPRGAGKS